MQYTPLAWGMDAPAASPKGSYKGINDCKT